MNKLFKINIKSKFELLGLLNLIFAILFLLFLIGSVQNSPPQFDLNTIVHVYSANLIPLISLIINIYLGLKLLWKKDYIESRFKQYLVLTLHTLFWFLWIFIGYFFASRFIYPILSLILITGIFMFVKKLSLKLALLTSFVTVLVTVLTVAFGFEENYCWNKGDEMAMGQSTFLTIATQEAKSVFPGGADFAENNSSPPTTDVGRAAYYHFKCHQNFDFTSALKEKYLQFK